MSVKVQRVKDALALLRGMDPDANLVIDQGGHHEPVTGIVVGWIVGDPGGRFAVVEDEPGEDEVNFLAVEGVVGNRDVRRCVVVK